VRLDGAGKLGPALDQRTVQKIKGKEHKPLGGVLDCPWQRIEVRNTVFVLDNDLAIDQRRPARKPGARVDYRLIASRPIIAVAGESARFAVRDVDQVLKPSCLISCSQSPPFGGSAAEDGIWGGMNASPGRF
jgi:hypothetical protein